jgi:putative chitinase
MNLNLGDTQLIIKEAKARGVLRNQLAYILATAYHETAHTMKPVQEAFWLSEAWRKKNLRYYPWHGRGYVQLTWDYNYKKAEEKLRVPFTKDPTLAMVPEYAAKILVLGMIEGWFVSGHKLDRYITLQKSDFVGARRMINGTDKKDLIAGIARDYDASLKKIGYGVT